MVSFPQLLRDPNFALEVVMIKEEEVRQYVGKRRWRTRGWGVQERRLLEVLEQRLFQEPEDWLALLPDDLGEFTAKDLARAIGVRTSLSQKMVYCFRHGGLIELIGKQGRANLYATPGPCPSGNAGRP